MLEKLLSLFQKNCYKRRARIFLKSSMTHVNKTSFNKIFKGTQKHYESITTLVSSVNRLVIHATHFTKWYILNVSNDFIFKKEHFDIILKLFNKINIKPVSEERKLIVENFKPYIIQYMKISGCVSPITPIKYFDQLSDYHAATLATNFIVNIQEHFIQKLKAFTSYHIMKKRPENSDVKLYQKYNRAVQNAIFTGNINQVPTQFIDFVTRTLNHLEMPAMKKSSKSRQYDLKVHPLRYLKSYLFLCKMYDADNLNLFNFVPLSTSFIPRHITIDSKLLAQIILKVKLPEHLIEDVVKYEMWSKVFNLKKKAFQGRKHDSSKFTGMIRTDGVSISIIIGPQTTKGNGTMRKRKKDDEPKVKNEEYYFQDVDPDEFHESKVFIDPNKRDLLYCLGNNDKKIRYTQSQRQLETKSKKYRKLREKLTHENNMNTNPLDTNVSKKVLDPRGYDIYLKMFYRKFKHHEEFYSNKIFRKLRLNTFMNTQKSEAKFLKKFEATYSKEATIFIGDWDTGGHTLPGQISTKGKGFRTMFRRAGYSVYLVNEHKSSVTCPVCFKDELKCLKKRESPKPWRKGKSVTVHGLLHCQSEICQQANGNARLWNRDDVATLNIKTIVEDTLLFGERPQRFNRKKLPV